MEDLKEVLHAKKDGYWLSFFDDTKEEFPVFWMARHVRRAEYNVECPTCQRHSKARILKKRGMVENISCNICGFVVIERIQRSRETHRGSGGKTSPLRWLYSTS